MLISVRRRGALAALVVAGAALTAACGSGSEKTASSAGNAASGTGGAGGSQLSLTFSGDYSPAPFTLAQANEDWVKSLKRASKGRIGVRLFFGGALYKSGDQAARALASGQLDLAELNGPNLEGIVPDIKILDLPFVGKTLTADSDLTDPDGPLFKALAAEADKKGITLLPVPEYVSGELAILMKGSVSTLADLEGTKIRSPGDTGDNALLAGLKANAINLPPADLATALKTGTVKGAIASTAFANSTAKGMVQTDIPLGYSGSGYLIAASKAKWESLPQADRDLIVSTLAANHKAAIAKLGPSEQAAQKAFADQGPKYEIYKMSAADKAKLKAIYEPLCEKFKDEVSPAVFTAFVQQATTAGMTPPCR